MTNQIIRDGMIDKVIRDGKVAVLYSPGFGAGWTTWNLNHPLVDQMLFDPDIVNAILDYQAVNWTRENHKNFLEKITDIALEKYEASFEEYNFYHGGLREIAIMWVDEGRKFTIDEYDGSESFQFIDEIRWIVA